VGSRAVVLKADLARPLSFAEDAQFDVVVCSLVMHYLKDWQPAFREFHRVLKPRGVLVFSTHHPTMDWQQFNREDYFAVELLDDDWGIGKVQFYRRPLTLMSHDLDATGFFIERLLEPQPTEVFRQANPAGYERLSKNPWFLAIRARKKE
jgi:SAM-dependent methyltransferase